MRYWEYKTVKIEATGWFTGGQLDASEVDEQLNKLGMQGWEAITSAATNMGYGQTKYVVYTLKRECPAPISKVPPIQ
ncbi:MAG: DUF4177 domain-containing protein [Pirellulaceae bacterium]|nr:DUF4177 domain-containing protein [Pirellulaceae bacterium]